MRSSSAATRCARSTGDGYIRHNELYRQTFDLQGKLLAETPVAVNDAVMMYSPYLEESKKGQGPESLPFDSAVSSASSGRILFLGPLPNGCIVATQRLMFLPSAKNFAS